MARQNIEQIAISDLSPWTRNARTHSKKQIRQIAESIETFGFTNGNAYLCRAIPTKLIRKWPPQQIAGWLMREHPEDESKRVSHETIYPSLFIQARGVLKKELLAHLRTTRSIRRSRHATLKRSGLLRCSISVASGI